MIVRMMGKWIEAMRLRTVPAIYLLLHIRTWRRLVTNTGALLNPVLGITARNLLMFSLMLLFTLVIDTI